MRARVPAAGRSGEAEAAFVDPLRERPLGLRALALVLRTCLAAVPLTVRCPLLFMNLFGSSFQASAGGGLSRPWTQLAQLKSLS